MIITLGEVKLLSDLPIKLKYSSEKDDLINDFYIPVLSNSVEYLRISGYFSSSALAVAARGMENFIKNDGKMKLVCNAELSIDDYNMIKEAQISPESIIEKRFIEDLNNIHDDFVKDHVEALGWMIANNHLEVKIAIPKEPTTFHPKVGVLIDKDFNFLSFSGSDNESANGWLNNIEEFKTFKSWESSSDYVYADLEEFNEYWYDLTEKTSVIDIPTIIRDALIEMAPNSKRDLKFSYGKPIRREKEEEKQIRPYQEEAINDWFDNGCSGIYDMCTASGKTFTALETLNRVFEKYKKDLFVVIVCPTKELVNQWEKDVKKVTSDIIKAYSDNKWKTEIDELILEFNTGTKSMGVVITTYNTFSGEYFLNKISTVRGNTFLIADEVHHLGANTFSNGIKNFDYDYRLGLSATTMRHNDEEGSEVILNYFNGIVHNFSSRDGLTMVDEWGNSYLSQYNYMPCFVNLSEEESKKYIEYTKKIAKSFFKNKDNESKPTFNKWAKERKKIVDKAESKYKKLRELLNENDDWSDLIIFCIDRDQVLKVKGILNEFNISTREFTSRQSNLERTEILDNFSGGLLDSIVAIKCLDEGINIPSAKTAIIMASSTNPAEYIQRLGRVLRRSENKDIAVIYDMLVVLSDDEKDKLSDDEIKVHKDVMRKEMDRVNFFKKDATNRFKVNLDKYYYW